MLQQFIPGSVESLLILLTIGIVLLYCNKRLQSYGRILLSSTLIIYWLLSTQIGAVWLEKQLIQNFEPITKWNTNNDIQAIVVLSGGGQTLATDTASIHTPSTHTSYRVLETLRLHNEFPNLPIILSGGIGNKVTLSIPEAKLMHKELLNLNVPDQLMLIESMSQNTYEQALNIKQIMLKQQINKIILITSPIHMKRAIATFHTQNINVLPSASTNQSNYINFTHLSVLPSRSYLYRSQNTMREILAFEYYKQNLWIME